MGNSASSSRDNQVLPEKPGDSSSPEKPRDSSPNPRDRSQVLMKRESRTAIEDFTVKKKQGECSNLKLWKCMEAYSDYYHPILAADKAGEKTMMNALRAELLPSSVGRELTECKGDQKIALGFYLLEGPCTESLTRAFISGAEEDKDKLVECFAAHYDYHHRAFKVAEAGDQVREKEIEAFLRRLNEDSDQPEGGEDASYTRFSEFMKGGGCKDSFMALEDCLKEAEKKKISEQEQVAARKQAES